MQMVLVPLETLNKLMAEVAEVKELVKKGIANAAPTAADEDELLNAREIQKMLKISVSTFYEWIEKKKLPEGISIAGTRPKRWWRSDVEAAFKAGEKRHEDSTRENRRAR